MNHYWISRSTRHQRADVRRVGAQCYSGTCFHPFTPNTGNEPKTRLCPAGTPAPDFSTERASGNTSEVRERKNWPIKYQLPFFHSYWTLSVSIYNTSEWGGFLADSYPIGCWIGAEATLALTSFCPLYGPGPQQRGESVGRGYRKWRKDGGGARGFKMAGSGWLTERQRWRPRPQKVGWDRPLPGLADPGAPQSRECARSQCSVARDSLRGLRGLLRDTGPGSRALPPPGRGRGSCEEGSRAWPAWRGVRPARPVRAASWAQRPAACVDVRPLESVSTVAMVPAGSWGWDLGSGPGGALRRVCCPGPQGLLTRSLPRCFCF